jgi:hypothetical protein
LSRFSAQISTGIESSVFDFEFGKFKRQVTGLEDRLSGALRNTGSAVDTLIRVDVELRNPFELGFIALGMNAIHRAHFNAQFVFDASVRNDVGHSCSS